LITSEYRIHHARDYGAVTEDRASEQWERRPEGRTRRTQHERGV